MKEFNEVLKYLPSEIRGFLEELPIAKKEKVSEIRIRTDKPVSVTVLGKSVAVTTQRVTDETMKRLIASICQNSEYSHTDEINEGFITFGKGHRAGLSGTAVYTNGQLTAVRDISSVNIRIARVIKNSADEAYRIITSGKDGKITSTVIASVPGGGKTTVLRSLAKLISDSGKKVSVIDERSEMKGFDLGDNTDLLVNYKKETGILTAIRSLSPDVIICDEIGSEAEIYSFSQALRLGVPIIATVHAETVNDIKEREPLVKIIKTGGIKRIIFLEGPENAGKIKETVKIDDIFN